MIFISVTEKQRI